MAFCFMEEDALSECVHYESVNKVQQAMMVTLTGTIWWGSKTTAEGFVAKQLSNTVVRTHVNIQATAAPALEAEINERRKDVQ